ncbi:branched-chain amino acid ABC transporter permease [Nocardioides nitrophenolicus]|uniref:branched-chain amino acid ABC transporter permease n=1 Tax=Nocardioides nitrophenolicus TaxID=60489 RepID=UPI00195802D1|nr:branched-chain amino acid ABC transporter permease [Nocardioides nitrophenolicus]MBM7518669.1 branched-chain amino acid transport system permease protein [Nocardioides nitrophenolicus]
MVDYLLGVGILAAVYSINALSLNLQVGVTGLLNFGQVAFVGIGAYSVAILDRHDVPWFVGFVVGAVLAAFAGALVGRLGRTLASDYWAIATLALAELVRLVALNQEGLTGGAQGLSAVTGIWTGLSGTARDAATFATVLALLAASYVVARRVRMSQYGRVLVLIRENPDLAASLRHNVVSAKARVMALSAVLASVAGGFYAMYISFIGPSQLLPFATFLIFTMVVVGGLGNTTGAVVGAVLITVLYDGTRFVRDWIDVSPDQAAGIRILVIGVVLLGFLLVRTEGIVPEKVRAAHARR